MLKQFQDIFGKNIFHPSIDIWKSIVKKKIGRFACQLQKSFVTGLGQSETGANRDGVGAPWRNMRASRAGTFPRRPPSRCPAAQIQMYSAE